MRGLLTITIVLLLLGDKAWGAQGGIVTTKVGPSRDNAYSVVCQPDGKIVVAGASHNGKDSDFAVLRYTADGSLDKSFGDGGVALFDSKLGDDQAYAVAIQMDGKIIAVGSAFNGQDLDMVMLRFSPEGVLDSKFGRNGVVKQDFSVGKDIAYAVAIQPDGKILMSGAAFNGRDLDFATVRVEVGGRIDPTFGSRGRVVTGFGDVTDRACDEYGYSIIVQPDGKIVVSGYSEVGESSVFATVRYSSNGQLDKTWNGQGMSSIQIGQHHDRAYTSAVDSDGRILVAGSSSNGKATMFALLRYAPNGKLDTSFGNEGRMLVSIGQSMDVIYSLVIQDDGKIVAGGSSVNGTDANFAIVRFLPSGALDTMFGSSGVTLAQFNSKYNAIYSVSLQKDKKILAAGVSTGDADYQLAVARYNADGVIDSSFGTGDTVVARTRQRNAITAEVGLPGWVFPLFPGAP